jgi:hypothetical protein
MSRRDRVTAAFTIQSLRQQIAYLAAENHELRQQLSQALYERNQARRAYQQLNREWDQFLDDRIAEARQDISKLRAAVKRRGEREKKLRACSETRKDTTRRRKEAIDALFAEEYLESEIYGLMLTRHPDLMKGWNGKPMQERNMWSSYNDGR